jgi:cytochrome c-type biogenesis protein CcmE
MSKNTKIIVAVIVALAACSIIAGFVIFGIGSLLGTASESSLQYFLTVSEVLKKDNTVNKQVRISGAVIGESIEFDETNQTLSFRVADIPADNELLVQEGGLAAALENAVNDPNRQRIQIVYIGEKPELLRNQAQAIMIGKLQSDGIFYADEILLKCPSRYEEALPDQAID